MRFIFGNTSLAKGERIFKKISIILLTIQQLISSYSIACDYRLLAPQVESLYRKIWQCTEIPEAEIKQSLGFLHGEEHFKREYPNDKYKELANVLIKFDDENNVLNKFITDCSQIYSQSDIVSKIELAIILEELNNKLKAAL